MEDACAFCRIVAGSSDASVVYEDDRSMCFMTLRPTRPGECLVVPKDHIDHFIDIAPDLLAHLAKVIRSVGRVLQAEFTPLRVGLVVHGFGVPHAHFILVPQHDVSDITSGRFAVIEGGGIAFRQDIISPVPREQLDAQAARLRARMTTAGSDIDT